MAKVKIVGDAFVISTVLTLEELKSLKKFNPKALVLFDAENKKEAIFGIDVGDTARISEMGITFTSADNEGKASATFTISTGLSAVEKKQKVADMFGRAILNLNALESVIGTQLADFNEAVAEIEASIEV